MIYWSEAFRSMWRTGVQPTPRKVEAGIKLVLALQACAFAGGSYCIRASARATALKSRACSS
jgi:hypothetical protein